jgi:hypothetical protein
MRRSFFGSPEMNRFEVQNLKVHFPVKPGVFGRVRTKAAVDDHGKLSLTFPHEHSC